ncbi:uncharacterized protein [Amphiura filiformis]|uniref:uncharacterized protein n=1 Tax=Amphiura filiformis TaxID=82378 RepID=UPI003B2149BD
MDPSNNQQEQDYQLSDETLNTLNQLFQKQQQQEMQQQLQQRQEMQQLFQHQQHEQQQQQQEIPQQIEDRMRGNNPDSWLFPENVSESNTLTPQNTTPVKNACLPKNIPLEELQEYFPSGPEDPEEISMDITSPNTGPGTDDDEVMIILEGEERNSFKAAEDVFNEIGDTMQATPQVLRLPEVQSPDSTVATTASSSINVTPQQVLQLHQQQYLQEQQQQGFVMPGVPHLPVYQPAPFQAIPVAMVANSAPETVASSVPLQQMVQQVAVPKRMRVTASETACRPATTTTPSKRQSKSQPRSRRTAKKSATMTNPNPHTSAPAQQSLNSSETKCDSLPEHHELQIDVQYCTTVKIDKRIIRSPKGCIIYHNYCKEGEDMDGVEGVTLPLLDTRVVPGITTHEQIKYTNRIVNYTEKGVRIFSDETGIYAVRHCRSKVFYWSPQRGDSEAMVTTEELPRDQKVLIFDYKMFKKSLINYLQAGKDSKIEIPWYPTVVMTFAQQWNTRCALNTNLVFAIVEPLRPTAMLEGLFARYDVKPTIKRLNTGLHSMMCQFSML